MTTDKTYKVAGGLVQIRMRDKSVQQFRHGAVIPACAPTVEVTRLVRAGLLEEAT